jgi:phosphatidylserine decarboxylase
MFNLWMAALAVRLARVKIPSKRLRVRLYRTIYGKKYAALNETELEKPLWAYPSFNALFTRGVKAELRPIEKATDQLLCPCDGTIQEVGQLAEDKLLTVKGVEYTVGSLLAGMESPNLYNGKFAVIFLSPSDCHRIFSPQDGTIEEILHVPGYRLLVHPPFQRKEFPVFTLNERVILRLKTPLGDCVLVLVAGWGVGNITLPVDPGFRHRFRGARRKSYHPPLGVKRGEWLATFELGSTAILLTEPARQVTPHVRADQKVQYGQPIFSVRR